MKDDVLGANWSPAALNTDHAVVPPVGLPLSSVQSNAAPPQSCTSMPRCFLYQAPSAAGSLALKKIPPIPVTLFIRPPCECDTAVLRMGSARPGRPPPRASRARGAPNGGPVRRRPP